jgi:hypothetical protein
MTQQTHKSQENTNVNQLHIGDTYLHSWEVLGQILTSKEAEGMLLDVGM